jgi:hypothetical protein
MVTRGLIDYIDYGLDANSFLITIGVLSYPSASNRGGARNFYLGGRSPSTLKMSKGIVDVFSNVLFR